MEIKKIGIIGAGLMGGGIAQNAAQCGMYTINIDTSAEVIERTKGNIKANLDKLIKRGKFTEEFAEETISRMSYSQNMQDISDCDIIIEAVPENPELKKNVYKQIEQYVSETTPIFTNTSSISITSLSTGLQQRDRFIGAHFFNPVPVMKLIELIPGLDTSDETLEIAKEFGKKLGKIVAIAPDVYGFITTGLIAPLHVEINFMIAEGYDAVQIDQAWKLYSEAPMGPVSAQDFSGLQVSIGVLNSMYEATADDRFRPAPLLKKLVSAGKIGKPSGEGFLKWD